MWIMHIYCILLWSFYRFLSVNAFGEYIILSNDGPVVLGGTITFRADLYGPGGSRPSGTYRYNWKDSAVPTHEFESEDTQNTTTYWSISYPPDTYTNGTYEVEVVVSQYRFVLWWPVLTSERISFNVTPYLNGNITILQSNKTLDKSFVSSVTEAKIDVNMRKGDYNYITQKATAISTYWFIDCKPYGQTNDFSFNYNFTTPDTSHHIGALVVASYEPPTTVPPSTTTVPTTTTANSTSPNTTTSTTPASTTTLHVTNGTKSPVTTTEVPVTLHSEANTTVTGISNFTVPYMCFNSSFIPMDPNKTYGYFDKEVHVRAPITNISVEGTNWIQPWDMLSLNVTCKGSGPFYQCLQFHHGKYNVTGNETCDDKNRLYSCNFSILHYFLEPSVYTILVILNNDVSTQVYPITINIYKVTTKPQLSVIVVPVSCTLCAVVLIIFGIAYYIQSRAKYTIEVADFDFGQNNPEMEYKTFTERLRDSFNNAGYKPLGNTQTLQ